MKQGIVFVLFAGLLLSLAQAQRVTGPGGKVVTYNDIDGVQRELELFFPEGHDASKTAVPGIMLFHGGGWGSGSREVFRYQCAYFAKRGMVAATVTYRLANKEASKSISPGTSRKRICIPDAKSAIRWFKQHAEELGVDPKRIIAGGGSAGGHISLIATQNPALNDPADAKTVDTSVAALILFNPALSAVDAADPEIDVIQHLKPGMPPAIAFFGSKDKWLKGWNPAYAKWKKLDGALVEVEIAQEQNHAFFNRQPWADLTLISADRFLTRLGFLEGEPSLPLPESGERLEQQTP